MSNEMVMHKNNPLSTRIISEGYQNNDKKNANKSWSSFTCAS